MPKRSTPVAAVVAPEKQLGGLRRFNLVMGFLHLVQGILMIVLSNATTYPIYTNFLKFDLPTRSLTPDPKLVFELPFGPAWRSSCCFRPWPTSRWPRLAINGMRRTWSRA